MKILIGLIFSASTFMMGYGLGISENTANIEKVGEVCIRKQNELNQAFLKYKAAAEKLDSGRVAYINQLERKLKTR